jgi:hypothetical protein
MPQSADLWSRLGGPVHVTSRRFEAWRVVEGQHVVSTRKLVDTAEEQEILEALIETVKPAPAQGRAFQDLHYLLATPFRYPPLRHGSRFGARGERGLWYGSLSRRTTLAERAYYRLLFLEGTTADLSPVMVQETAFRAAIRARRYVDLTAVPFQTARDEVSSPISYAVSQPLGAAMRAAGVQAFSFASARDREGTNIALFEPVFSASLPLGGDTWACTASKSTVEFRSRFVGESHLFPRSQFEIAGKLPSPGLGA